ncbi:hypothetical protein DL98DRAFT_554829 [Cadophora sp. DSE1049]|nr:hypothetical protein DL98DRAFT_554829 [Cadophora sp. DSE1049]
MHGYDIGKYAMLLAHDNGLGFGSLYPDRVYTDASDRGQGYVSDYRATMSSLLALYYGHLVNWSKRYLGLEFSAQVGYGLPVDMLELVPAVSVPEDESLGFDTSIGYGYEYLSPSNFQLPQAIVENRLLAPSGPGYKVLVLRSTELLTTNGVDKLAQYAKQGLSIIISGGIPNQIASAYGLSEARKKIMSLVSLPNVHIVGNGPLAPVISSIGIQPLTKVTAEQRWYTYWRELNKDGEAYVFVYNDENSTSTGKIKFASTKLPHFLDAWTGEQTLVVEYQLEKDYTTIALTLAPHQSVIVAFLSPSRQQKRPLYVTSGPTPALGYTYSKSGDLIVKAPFSDSGLTLSVQDKEMLISTKDVAKAFNLHDWTLVAEKWGPPADFNDASASSSKVNTTYKLPSLLSWPLIPGLQNTSGVGYYSNTFSWSTTSLGAFIDFGRVVHSLRVTINGHQLPPLDVTHARADISPYLVKGANEITAVISTTMINGLRPYLNRIQTSGGGPRLGSRLSFLNVEVEAGLVGEVVVIPYKRETVRA